MRFLFGGMATMAKCGISATWARQSEAALECVHGLMRIPFTVFQACSANLLMYCVKGAAHGNFHGVVCIRFSFDYSINYFLAY